MDEINLKLNISELATLYKIMYTVKFSDCDIIDRKEILLSPNTNALIDQIENNLLKCFNSNTVNPRHLESMGNSKKEFILKVFEKFRKHDEEDFELLKSLYHPHQLSKKEFNEINI